MICVTFSPLSHLSLSPLSLPPLSLYLTLSLYLCFVCLSISLSLSPSLLFLSLSLSTSLSHVSPDSHKVCISWLIYPTYLFSVGSLAFLNMRYPLDELPNCTQQSMTPVRIFPIAPPRRFHTNALSNYISLILPCRYLARLSPQQIVPSSPLPSMALTLSNYISIILPCPYLARLSPQHIVPSSPLPSIALTLSNKFSTCT